MKRIILLSVMMLAALAASAQQRNNVVPSFAGAVEDFKPNVTNQRGHQYPMVNSQGAVRAQLRAPQANSVQLDIGGKRYEMVKDENGVWTGTSDPQDVGFHYYQLNVDGASVPDPGTIYFFGAGRWGSGASGCFGREVLLVKGYGEYASLLCISACRISEES